jgi:hypothetical protein
MELPELPIEIPIEPPGDIPAPAEEEPSLEPATAKPPRGLDEPEEELDICCWLSWDTVCRADARMLDST